MLNVLPDKNCFMVNELSDITEEFKNFIKVSHSDEITLDLSALNIIESLKVLVLSSAYYFQKYPQGKIKCKTYSKNMDNVASGLITGNIEFI